MHERDLEWEERPGHEGQTPRQAAPVTEESYGRVTRLLVPGGAGEMVLYQPRHESPLADFS